MASSKKYFHDHLVLLLLSVQGFLAIASSIYILFTLTNGRHGNGYYVQYRPGSGVNVYKAGGLQDLLAFIVFAFFVCGIHYLLSRKAYAIHRQLSIAILALGILLVTLSAIISYSLLLQL